MKLFRWATDGGEKSGVKGFFIIECKPLFSIVLLRFSPGSREAFHSHAFNALTWFLRGWVVEQRIHTATKRVSYRYFGPCLWPKFTPRDNCHRVMSLTETWALSIRGPWTDTWFEYLPDEQRFVTLTHGRKVVNG